MKLALGRAFFGVSAMFEAMFCLERVLPGQAPRVALEEAERGLMLVRDPAVRQTLEALRQLAWRTLAERFHPGTGQMAGPQSRAYSDWLPGRLCGYLHRQTGIPISPRTTDAQEPAELVQPLPCPPELVNRFAHLPQDPLEITTRFAAGSSGDTVGTTWLSHEACLGSINRGHGWTQQRGLLGYWRAAQDSAVVLRARVLSGGADFVPVRQCWVQRGSRALSCWSLLYDCGAFHPAFDRPADNVFALTDLRVRMSLEGDGCAVEKLDLTRYVLRAGGWQTVIHTAAGWFGPEPVSWECGCDGGTACVDAVLYRGNERRFNFQEVPLKLAFGLELLRITTPASTMPMAAEDCENQQVCWRWDDFAITTSTKPQAFAW